MPTEKMNVKDVYLGNEGHLTSDESGTCEFTFESPTIRHIQSDRYELIKDLVKWAFIHDKDVLISEFDTVFTVTISNPQGSEDE